MKYTVKIQLLLVLACMAGAIVVSGCNARKRNTAAARQYTAFITRYNIHYNGDKHYRETLAEMEKNYEDDYTGLVYTHPAEARANEKAPQPQGDFTRSIEKAQKAIQLRSITKKPARKRGKSGDPNYKAWMKREEYNPFLHNDWMMMGRSQYMNGDFLGAAATFYYTGRHFSWLPATVTEAKLWQARSYLALDWLFEAEQILVRIKPDQLTTGEQNYLYNLDMGELYVRQHEYGKAAPYLEEASRHGSAAQKTRIAFLLGQVYERAGNNSAAYKAFGRAAKAASAPYRTQFNARIRQSEVFAGSDITDEVKALRRMTRYDRNSEYLDQIYYAIGNLYLSRRDTTEAIRNYELGAEKSTRNGIDKAILNLRLGGLYYEQGRYEKAQPCYAEAVPLLPENHPGLDSLKRRSDVLDELATYSQNVTEQDSLLKLAAMDSVARMDVINRAIDNLKTREKLEAEENARAEYLAQQNANGSSSGISNQAPQQFSINSDNSWYFYNQSARTAGRTEFQRRWGSRKLEDNWRRRNKAQFNSADFEGATADGGDDESEGDDSTDSTSAEQTPEEKERLKRADDPHYPEYYLKQIPFTAEQQATANDVIQEGLYNMGVILKDKMDDYPAAQTAFDRLLNDYPDNVYRLDAYYNLYLMYMRKGPRQVADRYRNLILSQFPESKQAIALRDPNYIESLRAMESEQHDLYDRAYQAYMDNRNNDVHAIFAEVSERYPMTELMPKFMFLEALAYVTDRQPEKFSATLKTLLERYPDTDLTPTVSAWLSGLAKGRKLQTAESGSNMRGMVWNISLGADSAALANGGQGVQFELKDDDRQLLVLSFPTDAVSANELLFNVARHNFKSFVVKDYDLEFLNFGRLGMIVIRDFATMGELNHYRKVMAQADDFRLPAGVRPVVISADNFDALLKSGATLDDYFRFLDEQNYIDAQRDLLPYTEIETLPEAEARHEADMPADTGTDTDTPVVPAPKPKPEKNRDAKETKPAQSAKNTKAEQPVQQNNTTNPLQNYDPGSEGDDPDTDEP